MTQRQNLTQVVRSGGRAPQLKGPPLPPAARHVWDWFLALHHQRFGGMGASPITDVLLMAWARMNGVQLRAWEREGIHRLDAAWFSVQSKAEQEALDD